jgi:hypothetical protein
LEILGGIWHIFTKPCLGTSCICLVGRSISLV